MRDPDRLLSASLNALERFHLMCRQHGADEQDPAGGAALRVQPSLAKQVQRLAPPAAQPALTRAGRPVRGAAGKVRA